MTNYTDIDELILLIASLIPAGNEEKKETRRRRKKGLFSKILIARVFPEFF
ncbi:hypothetical protein [Methanocalculus natronophilus]|uniref:hypothetical protein n=1 Tax=Methanocalculus natronophilus TaxID=1262400 RepID=UPI0031B6121D